jgi:hypothetical protein
MTFLRHLQGLQCNIVGMITNITTALLHHLGDQRHTINQRIIDTWTIDLLIKTFEALDPLLITTALVEKLNTNHSVIGLVSGYLLPSEGAIS